MATDSSSAPFALLAAAQAQPPIAPIEHVFVLMLENRAFDHFFGLSGIHGVQAPPASFGFSAGASDRLMRDPPHEYKDVASQVANGAMSGFGKQGDDTLLGFQPAQIAGSLVRVAFASNGATRQKCLVAVRGCIAGTR